MSAEKTNDEIDLKDVFRSIGNFFAGIGNGIIYFIASLRKIALNHKVLFVSILLLSQVTAVVYTVMLRKNFFSTSMILKSGFLNYEVIKNTMEKFDNMCQEKDRTVLAQTLKIDQESAKNLLAFEVRPFVSQSDEIEKALIKEQLNNLLEEKKDAGARLAAKLEFENASAYEITVKVAAPEVVPNLETSLVNYFKQNDYMRKQLESNRKSLLDRRAKLVRESEKIDSLKTVIFENFSKLYDFTRGSNNVILSDKSITGPIEVIQEDLNLNAQILEIDKKLYVEPDFVVVDGFTAFRQPSNLGLPIVLLIAAGLSILLSYLLIAFVKFNNYLDKIPV
jgi:hypothetical protein